MAEVKPRLPIRRFDVFAEYNRVKNLSDGMPEDQAMGRAIWLAKVVAGRRGMPAASGRHEPGGGREKAEERKEDKFYSVGGEEQTDKTFEKEIVDRMGREFYEREFRPAVDRAFEEGKRYEENRDAVRKDWK